MCYASSIIGHSPRSLLPLSTTEHNRISLTHEGKRITLLGTAHVSRESAELVTRVIAEERPDTVCVELCASRYQALTEKRKWEETDLLKVIKEKKAFLLLSNLMLSAFQKRIAKKLGIKPGAEMLAAIETARSVNAAVHLADRDIRTTLSRTWRLMGFWKKVKLPAALILSLDEAETIEEKDIEAMKEKDALEALLSEVAEALPEVKRVLIDERDQVLAHKIRNAPGNTIVAVVGAGHVPGILAYWARPIDLAALESLPPKGKLAGFLTWAIPTAIVGLIAAGFFRSGGAVGLEMVKWWVIITGVLAAAGAAAALAHPLTILSAFLAAPITTLHPLIAAGWVAGIVQVFLGKPKVKDFERLPEDILSPRGFWTNKITRILLIVVFTNIGASMGTLVALPLMMRMLG